MGFGGGRGSRGGFHSTSNSTAGSRSNVPAVGDDLVTHAAVAGSLRSSRSQLGASSTDATIPPTKWGCKMLVYSFERCGISFSKDGGKDNSFCQTYKQDLEKYCAKYKPYWSDWWTNELKPGYCETCLDLYNSCVSKRTKEHPTCYMTLDEYKEFCGV